MAANAIDFAGLAGLFVLHAFGLKESSQFASQNQHGLPVIAGWQAFLDPISDGICVNIKQVWPPARICRNLAGLKMLVVFETANMEFAGNHVMNK